MKRHSIFQPVFTLAICLSIHFCLYSQDSENAKKFDEIYAQLQVIEEERNQIVTDFNAVSPEKKKETVDQVRAAYEKKTEELLKLWETLKVLGPKVYLEKPNENKTVSDFMLSLASNYLQEDNNTKAAEIAKILTDNGYDTKEHSILFGMIQYCNENFTKAKDHLMAAQENQQGNAQATQYLQMLNGTMKHWEREQKLREAEAKADDLPRVKFETTDGTMVIELYENEAPQTVGNFISLVEKGYYDGLIFHRVLPNFMAQGGCPKGTGTSGPGYNIFCECYKPEYRAHFTGTLSMAHAGKNTGGSQFFMTFRPTPHLDGKHTAFGRIIEGLDVLPKIHRVDPQRPNPAVQPTKIVKATVIRKRDHEYAPTKAD